MFTFSIRVGDALVSVKALCPGDGVKKIALEIRGERSVKEVYLSIEEAEKIVNHLRAMVRLVSESGPITIRNK